MSVCVFRSKQTSHKQPHHFHSTNKVNNFHTVNSNTSQSQTRILSLELITINNVLADFENRIEDWVKSELRQRKLPDYYGYKLIIDTFRDKKQGFSESSIRSILGVMPSMKKYKNEFQEKRAKKRIIRISKKSLINKLSKKSIGELRTIAEPGFNLLSAMDDKK